MKNTILHGDVLQRLKDIPDDYVQMVCTSPPYWALRDYQAGGQFGLEKTPELYVEKLVEIGQEIKRVLRKDGTFWLNIGDTYRDKQLVGIPWRSALGLQKDGWYLRQDIIWDKPNPMPESVKDRCTKSHEYIFLFSQSIDYYFDHVAKHLRLLEQLLAQGSLYIVVKQLELSELCCMQASM